MSDHLNSYYKNLDNYGKGIATDEKKESCSINCISIKSDFCFDKKKKVSYYFPEALAEKFSQIFYSLKMQEFPIKNKSHLMTSIVSFALKDLEKRENSRLLKYIIGG